MTQPEQTELEQCVPPDPRQFGEVAEVYDQLMTGVPYQEWVTYLQRLLKDRNCRPRHVLDLACGTGNVTELLARAGFSVSGVDISEGMIEAARRKARASGLDIDFLVQDAAELDLPGMRFDLCVSLFDSLNYVTDPLRLQLAFHSVSGHLTRGGLFIFDLNSEYALRNHFFDQNNLGSEDRLRYDWVSDYFAETRLCRVRMKFWHRQEDGSERAFEEEHWQFAYRADEVKEMLTAAGFEEISVYQAYTMRVPTKATDRIFYVARRAF